MRTLKGWQQQIFRKTQTYHLLKRAFRNTQILVWRAKAIMKSKFRDAAIPAIQQENIAMFHSGRSGSTVLGELLYQHPKIFWDGEIYDAYSTKWKRNQVVDEAVRLLRRRMTYTPQKGFYGFEVQLYHFKFGHIKLSDYIEHLHALGINYFVILARKNHLRQIVSAFITQKRRQTHLQSHEKIRLTRITLDTKNLIELLKNKHDYFSMFNDFLKNRKVLRLTYEDDISYDPLLGYRRVCNFLNIDYVELPIRLRKTNPFKLTEMILNFEEVEHTLSGTPFEWMLYD